MEKVSSGLNENICCREQYWSELKLEEKIERMRGVVKSQEERLGSLQENFYRLRTFIEKHSHDNNGKLLMRIDGNELRQYSEVFLSPRGLGGLTGKPENKEEVYF